MIGLHTTYTMSIRQYNELEKSGDIRLLRRWWNILPISLFNTEPFFIEVRKILGEETDKTTLKKARQLYTYNRIIMLEKMLSTMNILMQSENQRNLYTLLFKRETKADKTHLSFYIEIVKQMTGIKIKDFEDLKRLQKEINRLVNKYMESNPIDKETQALDDQLSKGTITTEEYAAARKKMSNAVDFMTFALGIFSIMEMGFVSDMKLNEFGSLKILADKKIKQLEKNK